MILKVDRMPQKATLIELCEELRQILGQLDYEEAKKIATSSTQAHFELETLRDYIEQVFGTS